MILVDANLILYAYNSSANQHKAARKWLEETITKPEVFGLPWISIVAFLRISSNPSVFLRPYSIDEACRIVSEWFAQPSVTLLSAGERHWEILERTLTQSQATGPLVTDAHLAALAIEHGAVLCSTDQDFTRFQGLNFKNPLA